MVQSVNTKALFALASILRRPSLLVPHVTAKTVSDVNYESLRDDCGIRAVVFDMDNTLTKPYCDPPRLHPGAVRGVDAARSAFGRDNVAILSNSAGTKSDDPGYERATRVERCLRIAVIRHDEKKPGGVDDVLRHFDLSDPAAVCMVGDRILTDVVFGNLHGMLTVHTMPLCAGEENADDNWTAKLIRPVENRFMYGDWFGGRYLLANKRQHKFWSGDESRHPLTLQQPQQQQQQEQPENQQQDLQHEGDVSAPQTTTKSIVDHQTDAIAEGKIEEQQNHAAAAAPQSYETGEEEKKE